MRAVPIRFEGTGLSLGLGRQHREGAVTSTGEGMLGETVYDFGVILAPGKGVWASMGAPDLRFYVGYQRGTLSRNVAETDIAVVRHFRLRQRIVPHVMGGIGLYGLGPPIWVVAMGTDIMASSRLFVRLQYRLYADSSWIEWETGGLAGIGIRF